MWPDFVQTKPAPVSSGSKVRRHFFIIGAQRCGTTYLYSVLEQHPDVCMARPVRPEPKVFLGDEAVSLDRDWYYSTFFHHANPKHVLFGEKSTSYLEYAEVAARIAKVFTDARLLVMLRDPVARAVSNYRFSVQNGLETLEIGAAFAAESKRAGEQVSMRTSVSPFAYLRRGLYWNFLQPYLRIFGRNRMHVMIMEDFADSHTEYARLLEFLGLEPFSADLRQKVNTSDGQSVTLADDLEKYCREYFQESNERLREGFELDLGKWKLVR